MFTKKFNNLSDSLIEAAAKTLANPIVNEASNETPTINHLELSEKKLSKLDAKAQNPRPITKLITPNAKAQNPKPITTLTTPSSRGKDHSQRTDVRSLPSAKNQSLVFPQQQSNASTDELISRLRDQGLIDDETQLKGNQHRIDVAPPYGKLTKHDFDKLRNEQPQLSAQDRAELRQGRDPFRGDTTTAPRMNRPAAPPAPKPAPPAPPVAPRATMPTPSTTSAAPTPRPQIQLPMAPASQFGQTKVTPTHLYNPDTKETKPVPDEMRKSVSESMRSHLRELLKLNEAKRGRKPKDGGDPGDEGSYVDPETGEKSAPPKKHIMNQLRQAAQSMKAQHPVTYADGSTHNVPKYVAKALVNAYQDPRKKPYEREAMQAKIGQSHKELMQHHSELNEDSYNPPNGKKKMLLEPGVDKKNKNELDEVPVETVKQVRMFQQDEEQVIPNAKYAKGVSIPEEKDEEPPFQPDAKRTKRPDEPTTARGLARAAMRRAMEKAKQKEKVNEEQTEEMHPRQKIRTGSFVKDFGSQVGVEIVGFKPGSDSSGNEDLYTVRAHLREPHSNRFTPVSSTRDVAASTIHKSVAAKSKMKWREDTAHSEPHPDQDTIQGHKEAIKFWTAQERHAKTDDERRRAMRKMADHQGQIHSMERQGVKEEVESIDERHMSDSEMKNREDIVMGMKQDGGVARFKKRYGDRWREVMYATATKQAMKDETPKGADGVKVEPEMPFQGSGGVQSTKV